MEINDLLKDPEQLKGIINLLQSIVDAQSTNAVSSNTEDKPIKKKRSKKTENKSAVANKKNNSRENKFLDMPEMNLHKEDTEIDKKLHKLPPTPRSRSFKQIKAICRVCGKSEKVNPGYITTEMDRYKCNKCAGAAG